MVVDEHGEVLTWPKGLPWSHSALGRCEECPLMYGETNVRKHFPFVKTQPMIDGDIAHKQLENYLTKGEPLPPMLRRIGQWVDRISAGALEIIPERDVNLSYELEPCGVFHDDISYRGRIDLTIIRPDWEAIIGDLKTGRNPTDGDEQIEYQALALMLEKPKIKRVHGYYLYTKHDRRKVGPIEREHVPFLVKRIVPRLLRMKEIRTKQLYEPKPGIQCRWCPVKWCEYNASR